MGVKQQYLRASVDTLMMIDPTMDRDVITKIVQVEINRDLRDPTVTMDNNVTMKNFELTLTELCNWIEAEKPVVAGNATFYEQPTVIVSPASNMLRALNQLRDTIKLKMFEAKSDPDRYQQLDLEQINSKTVANAEYGASGSPTSAFYTKYSPAATTMIAQSIITTMATFFEGFIGDSMRFFHVNECFDWLNQVRQKADKVKVERWIVQPSLDESTRRICAKFDRFDIGDIDIIRSYLGNCSSDELTYIFYANNLIEFIRSHGKVRDILGSILSTLPVMEIVSDDVPSQYRDQFHDVDSYHDFVAREMFLDPYNVPPTIRSDMDQLTTVIARYCYVRYLTPDSIVKLNHRKRNTVLLVDTDSNVINANLFIGFVLDELFEGETFGRKRLYNDMICANILASVLDQCVQDTLDLYASSHKIDEEARQELSMKNEYFFRRFFLMLTKKRYASSIVLREGHLMVPFQTEIKGLDFIKAGVTDEVTAKFTGMLEKHVLFSDELQLHGLMQDLRKFEGEVHDSLTRGEMIYLKTVGFKTEKAYANPWQLQVFKAVMVWNEVMPIDQRIYSLNKVKLAKLIVNGPEDLDVIRDTYPKEYQSAIVNVFNSRIPELAKAGMKTIAIPATLSAIPGWIIPLIDYRAIISDICNSFRSVLDSFAISEIQEKVASGRSPVTTGLISI